MSRNTAPIKLNFGTTKDLTAILLCAGKGRRTASIGSKSLIKIGDTNLINHQIATLKNKFPNIFDIIVVVGFEADKIIRTLSNDIRVVENENFENTHISRSISLGLRAAKSENVFIINGDILFDQAVFNNFTQNSCAGLDEFGRIDDTKVGTIVENYRVVNFAYGLDGAKWAQINFVRGKELDLLRKITYNRESDFLSYLEVLNKVLNRGGKIDAAPIEKNCLIKEFNSIKDIEEFNKNKDEYFNY